MQSPQEQRAIVQRMIDAGESEENIATVIQHFKKVDPAKQPLSDAPKEGRDLGGTYRDVGTGILKSVMGLGESIIRSNPAIAVTEMLTGKPVDFGTGINNAPTNAAQSVGKVAGDVATALAPGGLVTRGARMAAGAVPAMRGASVIRPAVRALVEGGGQATIADVQGGSPEIGAVVGGITGGASQVARGVRGAMVNPNVVEREALEYVAGKGVPVDAGTMSGNAALKGAKSLADKTFAGSAVASKEAQKEARGLATLGEQLAAKASPIAATAESAGQGLRSGVQSEVSRFHAEANQAYSALRNLEQSYPAAFEVDMSPVKTALRPVYEKILRQSTPFQQSVSKPLLALKNILEGPDIQPVSVADADLSAIKSIARGASSPETRDLSQGLAARAVVDFESALQKAVNRAGPNAVKALTEGRRAVKAKYQAQEILDELNAEPVRAFNMATSPRDTSIGKLRDLQKVAPQEMPKIGRAFLDDLLMGATKDGKFEGAASMATKWQNLGPQTKAILFRDPALRAELDKFFLAAKRLAENPNPSGTGGLVSIGTQGGLLYLDPTTGIVTQIAGAVLSKALRNPTVVRTLTQGMTAKPGSLTGQVVKQTLARLLTDSESR